MSAVCFFRHLPCLCACRHRIGLARRCKLVTKRLMLTSLADARHPDAEGFQDTAHVTFEVLAQPGQSFPGSDKATQPVGCFAAHVDRREPASAGKLRQRFGICGVRFVKARRQDLMCLARVDACGGQPQTHQPALQPNSKLHTLTYDPARRQRPVAKLGCHALGIGRTSPACDSLATPVHNTNRNRFQRDIRNHPVGTACRRLPERAKTRA